MKHYCRCRGNIINMCWIDEAEPVYYPNGMGQYNADKARYLEVIAQATNASRNGVMKVHTSGTSGIIPKGASYPFGMKVISAPRFGSVNDVISQFNAIRGSWSDSHIDLVYCHVDNSGSMSWSNMSSQLSAFSLWLGTNFPSVRYQAHAFSTERWRN